jgi:tRNA(Ile)-lysidine synthase
MNKKPSIIEFFKIFLQEYRLVDNKILLMVSGGVDSMVLLDVALKSLPATQVAVFHLNHNTRVESDADEIFVQKICSKNNIKFYSKTLPSCQRGIEGDLIKNNPSQPPFDKGGAEAHWRKKRQELSFKAANDFGAAKILTAHHATDLVETMIFRLTKGAGPAGLSPFDTSTKPFWNISKQVLLEYAQEHQLEWQEDNSNLNTKFERNLIRHEVLPVLRKITPNLESVFVRESETFSQVQSFLNSFFLSSRWEEPEEGFLKNVLKRQSIKLFDFLELPAALQNELLRTIASKNPSQSELADCLKWLKNKPEGNSQKEIGGTKLQILKKNLTW